MAPEAETNESVEAETTEEIRNESARDYVPKQITIFMYESPVFEEKKPEKQVSENHDDDVVITAEEKALLQAHFG